MSLNDIKIQSADLRSTKVKPGATAKAGFTPKERSNRLKRI